jgi:uncharacterized membrane protein YkvA (DUF1232 family)
MKKIRDLWQAATLFEKLTLIFSLLYVFTPIDFIPEVVFGIFGLVDDATAIGVFVWTIRKILRRLEAHHPTEASNSKKHQVPSNLIP